MQWITTCSAANVNIGQLLEMQTSLHTTAIANSSRPEPVYMRAQINLTPVILGTGRLGLCTGKHFQTI